MYAFVIPFLPKVIWPWPLPERRTNGSTFFNVVSALAPTLSSNESLAVIFRDRQVILRG